MGVPSEEQLQLYFQLTDFSKILLEVIVCLANQLSIDPCEFDLYSRKMTISKHTQLIKDLYSYRNFHDYDCQKIFYDWLLFRVSYTTETTEMLSDMLLKKCLEEKILLSGVSVF